MKLFQSAAAVRSPERILSALLAGYVVLLCLITVLAIGFSVVRIPMNRTAALSILGLSAIAACLCVWGSLRGTTLAPRQPARLSWRINMLLLLGTGICVAAYLVLWIVSYTTLDRSWDGNTYHLPTISQWAQEGRIHWIAPEIEAARIQCMNGFSKGAETVSYVIAMGCGSYFANTINCVFMPLGVLGIALLALRLGASPCAAAFAGSLYILVPVNVWQSWTTYVDSAFSSCAIAFFAFFHRYIEHSVTPGRTGESWTTVLLAGATLGLIVGVKGTGVWMAGMVFAAAGLAGVFFLCCFWFSSATSRWRAIRLPFVLRWFGQAGIALLVCLTAGGFWYARNYLQTGSPLYPIGVKIAGIEFFPGFDHSRYFDTGLPVEWRGRSAMVNLASAWCQSGDANEALTFDARKGGLGFFWALGCVPSILIVLLQRLSRAFQSTTEASRNVDAPEKGETWAYWILLGTMLVFFLYTPANWWARYTLWIYGIGLPCFAVVLTWLMRRAAAPVAGSQHAAEVVVREHFSAHSTALDRDICTNMQFRIHCPRPWRSLGVAWIATCSLLVLVEGIYSVQLMSRWQSYIVKSGNSTGGFCEFMYPELQGTEIRKIMDGKYRVATGVLDYRPHEKFPGFLMFGVLSQPLGVRHWGIVDRRMNEVSLGKLQAGEFDYLIWDSAIPLPTEYARLATLEKSCPGFLDLYRIKAPSSTNNEEYAGSNVADRTF